MKAIRSWTSGKHKDPHKRKRAAYWRKSEKNQEQAQDLVNGWKLGAFTVVERAYKQEAAHTQALEAQRVDLERTQPDSSASYPFFSKTEQQF